MPLIVIHTSKEEHEEMLRGKLEDLRKKAAEKLSCGEIELCPEEFSIRVIRSVMAETIADIEIEITAFAFKERISKQDEICVSIKDFVEKMTKPHSVYVWLKLCELGHSASE